MAIWYEDLKLMFLSCIHYFMILSVAGLFTFSYHRDSEQNISQLSDCVCNVRALYFAQL